MFCEYKFRKEEIKIEKCKAYHTHVKKARLDPSTVKYITGKYPENNGVIEIPIGECWGTREREECHCGGDSSKCTFYPEKRNKTLAESESAYENLGHIAVPETIDFSPLEDSLTSKYIDPPMRE